VKLNNSLIKESDLLHRLLQIVKSHFPSFLSSIGVCKQQLDAVSKSDKFKPQCDAKGQFMNRQCDRSIRQCWCVNTQTGSEIKGTRTNGLVECGCTVDGSYHVPRSQVYQQCNRW